MDTPITVTKAGDTVDAPATSPLFDLRRIRREKLGKLHLDLEVPRWDAEGFRLFVRFGPARPDVTIKAFEKRTAKKDPDMMANANADVLVDACIGVYLRRGDDTFMLVDGEWVGFDVTAPDDQLTGWTRFEPALAEALGLEGNTKAVDVVHALYFTPGDLIQAGAQLAAWSGVSIPAADEEALGE